MLVFGRGTNWKGKCEEDAFLYQEAMQDLKYSEISCVSRFVRGANIQTFTCGCASSESDEMLKSISFQSDLKVEHSLGWF